MMLWVEEGKFDVIVANNKEIELGLLGCRIDDLKFAARETGEDLEVHALRDEAFQISIPGLEGNFEDEERGNILLKQSRTIT